MKERFNRSLKEAVEAKTLLDQQQGAKVSEVEDKAKEAQNPVYADATRSLKRNQKVKADIIKVEAEPKHDENPKKPKMTPGAKKLKLDENLFEQIDSYKVNANENLNETEERKSQISYAHVNLVKRYIQQEGLNGAQTIDMLIDWADSIGELRHFGDLIESLAERCEEFLNEGLYQAQEVFTDDENKTFAKSELGMVDKDKLSDEDRRMIARRKLGLDKKKVWIDPKDSWTPEQRRDYARQQLGLKKKDENK